MQRGSGDEKRRQESAASYLSRPSQDAGASDVAANEGGGLQGVGGRAGGSAKTGSPGRPDPEGGRERPRSDFLREKAELAGSDSRSLFASVGFSAQQLAEQDQQESPTTAGSARSIQAFQAYGSAQSYDSRRQAPSGPQLVTESGVLMGFGAIDDLSRLDVTA
ncbi:MAG: hypothetical protein OEL53_15765 [Rhodospirillales bacterium]|nr:hypothetical protein [Rhodospirillales bacterium]